METPLEGTVLYMHWTMVHDCQTLSWVHNSLAVLGMQQVILTFSDLAMHV